MSPNVHMKNTGRNPNIPYHRESPFKHKTSLQRLNKSAEIRSTHANNSTISVDILITII